MLLDTLEFTEIQPRTVYVGELVVNYHTIEAFSGNYVAKFWALGHNNLGTKYYLSLLPEEFI